jgi:Icc-related predicted phosphoesterase
MTRLMVMSDLHLEFHPDRGAAFVAALDPADVDVLILAGDIASGTCIGDALACICARFSSAQVLYVHGNHEYYGLAPSQLAELTRHAVSANPNLVWLNGDTVAIGGRRYLGHTLWFPDTPQARRHKRQLGDFAMIRRFEPWVYEQNAQAQAFLRAETRPGDIVITHHLPSPRSTHPKYAGDPLNAYFVCDLDDVIERSQPALWIHGHTHESMDYQAGHTRVTCNPYGYFSFEVNPSFNRRLVIDLPPE